MSQVARYDGYVNMVNKYGTAKDSSTAYRYQQDFYTPDTVLTDHYSGNGLFARIIDIPADEAVKHGFSLTIEDEEITKYIEDQLEMLKWEDNFATAEKWSRLYGGAIIVMLIDDGGRLEDPLNVHQAKGVDELYVFERAVVTPNYNGSGNYGFSKPESFNVSSIAGSFTVHASRCLIFRNGKLPELVPDLEYRYFGYPEYHRIKQQLRETVTSHSYASKLLERSVQPVHKIKDLAALMSTQDGEEEVLKRLDLVDTARGILNTIAIDADGEDYAFQTFSFTGVQEIIDVHCNILSAVTSIPQTILFGRSPAGMNSTGQSDFENYYNMVEHIQKRNMKDNLRTLINLIIRQGKARGEILGTVGDFKIEFNPLWNMSDTEQAQVDQQKMATAQTKSAIAQTYIDLGVLDPTEARESLKADDIFVIDDSLDDDLEEAAEMEGEDPMAQMGGSPAGTGGSSAQAQPLSTEAQNAPTEQSQPKLDNSSNIAHSLKHDGLEKDGGPGSGNFNHKGVKGQVGGSAPSNRVKLSADSFEKGEGDFELTEKVTDMYLTKSARVRIEAAVKEVKTASQLKSYLDSKGIEFETPCKRLQDNLDSEIPAVKQQIDYVIAAVEQYDDMGGLSALKKIHFYDVDLDVQGQYVYRASGEGEVEDEGHIYLSSRCNGTQVMHEFAHAYADSTKPDGMDCVEWSAKLNEAAQLSSGQGAYFGSSDADREAERFADAIAGGFSYGQGRYGRLNFVSNVANLVNGFTDTEENKNLTNAETSATINSTKSSSESLTTASTAPTVSATGANTFVRGFESKQQLNNHFTKKTPDLGGKSRKEQYAVDGIETAEQYERRALELIQSPCGNGIDGYKNEKDEVVRYDRAKNDFVKGHPNKRLFTMFKPASGSKYFEELKEYEGVDDNGNRYKKE